jgi:hypothetical protein
MPGFMTGGAQLPLPRPAADLASRLATDPAIVAASLGDQSLEVEHGPSAALGTVRRELVIVLVQPAPVALPARSLSAVV